jgi:hypothetical protein
MKNRLEQQLGRIYLYAVAFFTVLLAVFAVFYASGSPGGKQAALLVLTGAAVLIPSSELSVILVNWLVCKVKKPSFFMKRYFVKLLRNLKIAIYGHFNK